MPEPQLPPPARIAGRPENGARSIVDMALGINRERPKVLPARRPPSPKASLTRRLENRTVPAPRPDWERLLAGTKRQYRTYNPSWHDRFRPLFPEGEVFPRPALIYSQHGRLFEAAPVVITAYRMEPLGRISSADLVLEGFAMPGQFKRYWKLRYRLWGWRPDDVVSVVTLRPWEEQDDEEQAAWLLRQLYGEWL